MDDAVVGNVSVINISITSVLYGGQYLCEVQNAAGNSSATLFINGKLNQLSGPPDPMHATSTTSPMKVLVELGVTLTLPSGDTEEGILLLW